MVFSSWTYTFPENTNNRQGHSETLMSQEENKTFLKLYLNIHKNTNSIQTMKDDQIAYPTYMNDRYLFPATALSSLGSSLLLNKIYKDTQL